MTEIAIAHKDYNTYGGGERLAEELCRVFSAPMYTGYADREGDKEISVTDISENSPLFRRMIARGGVTRQMAYILLWQRDADALRDYDVVITSGNEPLWYTPDTLRRDNSDPRTKLGSSPHRRYRNNDSGDHHRDSDIRRF